MPGVIDYLIVGGGVAGGHAIFEIRKHDRKGRIVVVNLEDYFPYDRPPLSKEYLAGKEKRTDLFFRADSYYGRNKVEFIKKHTVRKIDSADHSVILDDGRKIAYKTLLIATGGSPRKIAVPGSGLDGIHYLRTLDDCNSIKKAAPKSRRVVIVGGGFIGCEVAATLRSEGLNVTLIHKAKHVLDKAIDPEAALWIQKYHEDRGVRVITEAEVARFIGREKVKAVKLKDGRSVITDLVVVGIGIAPNLELGKDAGLEIEEGGIKVNQYLETGKEGIYAAGDIARFFSQLFERSMRAEHVDVAQRLGTAAGANMTGQKQPFDGLPYFFSNQYDLELNAYGDLSRYDRIVQRGSFDARSGFMRFYFEGGLLNAVLAVNADWKDIEKAKDLIESRKVLKDPAAIGDESRNLSAIDR